MWEVLYEYAYGHAVVFPAVVATVGAVLFAARFVPSIQSQPTKAAPIGTPILSGCGAILLLIGVAACGLVVMVESRIADARSKGSCETSEGVVESRELGPVPGQVAIRLDGTPFQFSKDDASADYSRVVRRDTPLKTGAYARIVVCMGRVVRVQVRRGAAVR